MYTEINYPLLPAQMQLNALVEDRTRQLVQKLQQISLKICGHPYGPAVDLVRYDNTPFNKNFAAVSYPYRGNLIIGLSYFFLVEPEDIPDHLKPLHTEDPRLFDDHYLTQIVNVIADKFGHAPFTLLPCEKTNLRVLLRLLANPNHLAGAKEFILGHEYAHLFYSHQHNNTLELEACKKRFSYLSIALNALFSFSLFIKTRSLLLVLFQSLLISYTLAPVLTTLKSHALRRKNETEADTKGALINREGGIHFFEAYRLDKSLSPDKKSWFSRLSLNNLCYPLLESHPSLPSRIQHLRSLTSVSPSTA